MLFQNRRQKLIAVLMSLWLCGWIGATLFHGITHAAQSDVHPNAPCLTCSLLHQPAPATLDFAFAPRPVCRFEIVCEMRAELPLPRSPILSPATSPRGPPALLFFA